MMKAEAPRKTKSIVSTANSVASSHLWDDFVKQVSGYARRNNIAHKGTSIEQRGGVKTSAMPAWYNQVSSK